VGAGRSGSEAHAVMQVRGERSSPRKHVSTSFPKIRSRTYTLWNPSPRVSLHVARPCFPLFVSSS
ncbi:unnamed protein product, partial [Ilex paraguariensis]